jgi:MFS family permease
MEKKLIKRFYISFVATVTMFAFLFAIFTAGTIHLWNQYEQGEETVFWAILFMVFLLITILTFIVLLIPILRDLPAVRKGNFERMTGTIIRYKRVQHGGEPPTHSWHPIVRDNTSNKEIELTIINRNENKNEVYNPLTNKDDVASELYGTYEFIYIPHTKLAVIVDKTIQD